MRAPTGPDSTTPTAPRSSDCPSRNNRVEPRPRKPEARPPTNGQRKAGQGSTEPKAKYEVAPFTDDVYAVSYLSGSGYTLTSVLDSAGGTVVSFASNEKELVVQHGTFEVAERIGS